MEGLLWGSFAGGVFGMAQQIVKEEFGRIKKERIAEAEMKQYKFFTDVDTVEDNFLILFEEAKGNPVIVKKLKMAANKINAVIGIYVRTKATQSFHTPHYAHALAMQNMHMGFLCLREGINDLIALKKDVELLSRTRSSIEKNVLHVMNCLHSLSLTQK